MKVYRIAQQLLTIHIQWFLYTVIKFQVINQAILNASSLPTLMLFVCVDLSIFNRLFQRHNSRIMRCKFSQAST